MSDRRTVTRRAAHEYVADLIVWGLTHGDDQLNERFDRLGQSFLDEVQRIADQHVAKGSDEWANA